MPLCVWRRVKTRIKPLAPLDGNQPRSTARAALEGYARQGFSFPQPKKQ